MLPASAEEIKAAEEQASVQGVQNGPLGILRPPEQFRKGTTPEEMFKCTFCSFMAVTVEEVVRHTGIAHSAIIYRRTYRCIGCTRYFEDHAERNSHFAAE